MIFYNTRTESEKMLWKNSATHRKSLLNGNSRFKKDDFNPSTQMVVSIAVTLVVSIDYLLIETERKAV